MHQEILDQIPFQPDTEALAQKLRIRGMDGYAQKLQQMLEQAQAIARPKALYRLAFINDKHPNGVLVEGVPLTSRVLRVNLETAQRVFVYLATCGTELASWADSIDDVLFRYWADAIQEAALHAALQALKEHLDHRYQLARTSTMNPGSLEDWPIEEQGPLFSLLGDTRAAIGVELTSSYLMIPAKSVSGIRFPLEESFESCQLCPRPDCPNRRAPYEAGLFEKRYQLK